MFDSIIGFFQEGGSFMYPIAVVFVIGLAIAIERFIYLTQAKISNKRAFEKILPLIKNADFKGVKQIAMQSEAPITRIISAGLSKASISPRRDDVECAMEEGILEAMPRLEKRTPYLATLANIATLLGLLGTIMGLIAAFTAVANADPSEKATLLSQSISVAMNTTAFGLISAIPLLLIHSLLQSRTTEIVDSLEMCSVKFLNMLSDRKVMTNKTRTSDKVSA
jgi:biopolymer transport protein ExbB